MKKLVTLTLLALTVLFIGNVSAQTSASADATVSVVLQAGLSVTKTNDLDFGTLAIDSGSHTVSTTSSNAGSFTITGEASTSVTVTFPSSVTLSDGGSNSLTMTPVTPTYSESSSGQATATQFSSVTGGTATLNSSGALYVWIGGTIDTNGATAATYSGTYTCSVAY